MKMKLFKMKPDMKRKFCSAYSKGYQSFIDYIDGDKSDPNPFIPGSLDSNDWWRGHDAACDDYRNFKSNDEEVR